jgi:hypothetical protein
MAMKLTISVTTAAAVAHAYTIRSIPKEDQKTSDFNGILLYDLFGATFHFQLQPESSFG